MSKDWSGPPEAESQWDADLAADIVGKRVLIGITQRDDHGNVVARHQMYGLVTSADRKSGIEVSLEGTRAGERYRLPPSTSAFNAASPGEYRLKATGEVVVDPDYTCVWTVTRPPR